MEGVFDFQILNYFAQTPLYFFFPLFHSQITAASITPPLSNKAPDIFSSMG
jgi:hypothetical protein